MASNTFGKSIGVKFSALEDVKNDNEQNSSDKMVSESEKQHRLKMEELRKRNEEARKAAERRQEETARRMQEAARSAQLQKLKDRGYERGYEYKIISWRDDPNGSCDTMYLQSTLNDLALEGWRVIAVNSNELGRTTSNFENATIDDTIIFLERSYPLD